MKRLLIANRGEIACRILRTAQAMGIQCAVVYSEADSNAMHVRMAETAFCIGPASASESYLDAERLIRVALQWQADAIHPGYGFLSENAGFASLCEQNGIRFVGPSSKVIEAMGSKARAKEMMQAAGVPLLPGYHGNDQSVQRLQQEADLLGYPLLIKAVAGGGGRGLRVVESADRFAEAFEAVKREAAAAFADSRVLLERYLPGARHVEVQIFADTKGHCVHLFERDCSLQRRHQKLIEEAPAPGLSDTVRAMLCGHAVKAATEIAYTGAGTVEFLYQDGECYFMEMNTRLQVEHGVTEAICGIDLVEWQLRIADGEALPLSQEQIQCHGWAIEARLNAESPLRDFLPASGNIESLHWPDLPGLRIDAGFSSGDRVSMHYDSLLAKLIVHAENRELAIRELQLALDQTRLLGLENNLDFLAALLDDPDFRDGRFTTRLVTDKLVSLQDQTRIRTLGRATEAIAKPEPASRWGSLGSWRNVLHNDFSRRFHCYGIEAPGHDDKGIAGLAAQHHRVLKAPLPGRIIAVTVKPGDVIEQGQTLIIIEAMKMEHSLTAVGAGVISAIHCQQDEIVQADQILAEIDPPPESDSKRETDADA